MVNQKYLDKAEVLIEALPYICLLYTSYSKDDIMAGLIQGVRHRCMIYDDNYAECIGIYQDQGERKLSLIHILYLRL